MKTLPLLSSLQFFIMSIIKNKEISGHTIRTAVEEYGEGRSVAAFYQLMSRMENKGLIATRFNSQVLNGQHLKEKYYKLTEIGKKEFQRTHEFYSEKVL